MGANPLSHTELQAFQAGTLQHIPAFWVEVIMRLDDVVLAAVSQQADDGPKPDTEVSVNDGPGLRAMFQRIGASRR